MSFDDVIFSEWLDHPIAYGAFENHQLLGFAEGFLEKWNHRYRISNICIFNNTDWRLGIRALLLDTSLREAHAVQARMAVLETQSCNENAIAFCRKKDLKSTAAFALDSFNLCGDYLHFHLGNVFGN